VLRLPGSRAIAAIDAPIPGARALVELEGRFARRLLEAWADGRSSLLERLVSA
jgi:hypothetical protein